MTWLARGTLLRVLAPLAAGVALAVALQAAEPAVRLYILISPSLLAGLAGLLGTGVLAAVALMRSGPPSSGPRPPTPRCGGPRPRPRRTGCAS
jgi:hypothetical protein